MFMGEYKHNIDTKGRLIVPSKFRDGLANRFIITRGLDGCLAGYSLEEWEKMETKIEELPFSKKQSRNFIRFFYSAATECEIDKQGRVNIPPTLREYAGISKECVVIGASKHIEVWDKNRWEELQNTFDDLEDTMMDFGF